jgi:hypothetical protein
VITNKNYQLLYHLTPTFTLTVVSKNKKLLFNRTEMLVVLSVLFFIRHYIILYYKFYKSALEYDFNINNNIN